MISSHSMDFKKKRYCHKNTQKRIILIQQVYENDNMQDLFRLSNFKISNEAQVKSFKINKIIFI
jgi:hypothetical protein